MFARFSRLALMLALAIALAACGGARQSEPVDEEPAAAAVVEEPAEEPAEPTEAPVEPTEAPVEEPAALEETPAKEVYAVGDTARLEDFLVSVTSTRTADEIDGTQALEGWQFVLVDLTLANTGAAEHDVAMLVQMLMEDGAGQAYSFDIGVSASSVMQLNGTFDPGEQASGTIGFQVPTDANDVRFIFRTIVPGALEEAGRVAFAVEL